PAADSIYAIHITDLSAEPKADPETEEDRVRWRRDIRRRPRVRGREDAAPLELHLFREGAALPNMDGVNYRAALRQFILHLADHAVRVVEDSEGSSEDDWSTGSSEYSSDEYSWSASEVDQNSEPADIRSDSDGEVP
ncbi:unnamed protein product, partial [Chrysoparadoxa australica]